MDSLVIDFALVVATIMALVQVIKTVGLPTKYAPIPALILGIAAGLLYIDPADWKRGILLGIIAALSAIGAWSGPKNILEAVRR